MDWLVAPKLICTFLQKAESALVGETPETIGLMVAEGLPSFRVGEGTRVGGTVGRAVISG